MAKDGFLNSGNFPEMFPFLLRAFYMDEEDNVCLNLIRDNRNIGKFRCLKADFRAAEENGEPVILYDENNRRITAYPAAFLTLDIEMNRAELFDAIG